MPIAEIYERITIRSMLVDDVSIPLFTCGDPFGIDDPCPQNSSGHYAIASCGDVVCVHCAKVFWA